LSSDGGGLASNRLLACLKAKFAFQSSYVARNQHRLIDYAARWMEHMRRGEFGRAWRISDSLLRHHLAAPCAADDVPRHQQVIWSGASLRDKRVLVRCYHGLGDTIQFIRYIPLLKTIAAQVTVWAQPALIPLLSTACGIDRMIPLHDGTPDCEYDADVEVMELPYVFRTTVETIPAGVPYFHVDPSKLDDRKMKVGLVWRGGDWDPGRNVPFDLIRRLAELQEVSFYMLQQDASALECHERFKTILPPGADALTTARLMRALDLVVSVDSMPAHLAGALGVPTWTLLQKKADWRWMNDRSDSPWYPTMRLFRQRQAADWQPLIARVQTELRAVLDSPHQLHSCMRR
jgi:Glycosyltransferase family 9 (heptosyltransferase)